MENSNIPLIMQTLSNHFNQADRTTLNSMREKNSNEKPDAFKILIACLLSLRSRDETTEKISKQLFQIADTPEKIINLPTPQLEKIIFSTGHYKKKAQILKHVSNEIKTKFNNQVPDTKDKLLSIKGIGPKTANIVLAFAYNQIVIPVDVNVHRVANRLGIVQTKQPEKTEKELEKILPKEFWRDINEIFILHGRNICMPISPKCSICPVQNYCQKVGVIKTR